MADTNKDIIYNFSVKTDTKGLNKLNKEVKTTGTNLKKSGTDLKNLGDGFNQLPGPIGGASNAVSSFFQLLKANPIIAVATAIIAVIKGLYEYSKASLQAAKDTTAVSNAMGVTKDIANDLRKEINVISAVWGKDYNEVLKSSSVLMKQFGLTGDQSLRLIKKGFESGADVNGEFLELLKEYPTQLKAVGLTAEESIALLTQTEQMGIYSDKGIDAIKEAGLRLKENTKATADSLKVLDEQTQSEIKLAIAKGDTFKAIQLVSKGLNDTTLSAQETQTIIADVFGGAGEDAGLQYLQTLTDINVELDELPSNLSDAEIASNNLTEEWTRFKDTVIEGDSAIGSISTSLKNTLSTALGGVTSFVKSDTSAWKKWLGLSNPIILAIQAINGTYDIENTSISDNIALLENEKTTKGELVDSYNKLKDTKAEWTKTFAEDGKLTDEEKSKLKSLGRQMYLTKLAIDNMKESTEEGSESEEEELGIIQKLNEKLKKLKKLRDESNSVADIKKYTQEIKTTQDELNKLTKIGGEKNKKKHEWWEDEKQLIQDEIDADDEMLDETVANIDAEQAAKDEALLREAERLAAKEEQERLSTERIETAKKESYERVAEFEAEQLQIQKENSIQLINELSDFVLQSLDNEMMEKDEKYQANLDSLERNLEDGIITQEEYNIAKENLEKNYDNRINKIRKKQFNIQKTVDIVTIAINTAKHIAAIEGAAAAASAQLIAALNAAYAWMPGGAGIVAAKSVVPLASIHSAAAVSVASELAIGAAQSAIIASKKFQAASGMQMLLNGPLHAAGGINLGGIEAEGGEMLTITNRASTIKYGGLLNSINAAGNPNGNSNNVDELIDYDRLGASVAAATQSKKVYVVSHEITDTQSNDVKVEDRASF